MNDPSSRSTLPSQAAWERLKSMLPEPLHERMDRLRFLLESLNLQKMGISFELHMITLEFVRELASRLARILPAQQEEFQKVVNASLKSIARASPQKSRPWWTMRTTYFNLATMLVVMGAAGWISHRIEISENTIAAANNKLAQQIFWKIHEEAASSRLSFENKISPNIEIRRLPAETIQVWIPYGKDRKEGRWEGATIKEIPMPESIGR